MCGFVGTTNKPLTKIMLQKQEHRGPDALSFWKDDKFGFGHALLDITGAKQTQPVTTPNGNILLFDNGNEHTPAISRAVEYSIDETNMIAELIWDYSHPEAYVGQSMGSSQRLPNNNTLINWGTINGEGAIITEVDFDKNIVFEVIYPSNTNCYKVRKEDWNFSTNLIPGDTNLDNKVNILDLFYM